MDDDLFGFGLIAGALFTRIRNRKLLLAGYGALLGAAVLLIGNSFTPLGAWVRPAYSLHVAAYTIVLFCLWSDIEGARFGLRIGIGLALCGWIASGAGIALSMAVWAAPPQWVYFLCAAALGLCGLIRLLKNPARDQSPIP